jgi:primase 1
MFLTENANNAENSAAELKNAAGAFLPFKPLKPSADSLPPFPIDCLPSRLRSYVEAVAIHTQTPMDMAAGAALGVLAACLQGKVKVEGNIGHYEQTSLYIFLIAPPGSRKSAVIHAMTAAIEDYEQKYNEGNKTAMRRNKQERESLQRDINRLTRQLEVKYDTLTELELQHTQDKLAELPEIKPLQIFTDDCTSESMIRLLRDNHGRMSLISAEGGAFDNIVGRYTKKPNLDVWLKGICGDTIRVDRINREPDYIRNPALSMIISAQPGVLSELMQSSLLDGRGFLARLFYINIPSAAMPKSFRSAPIPATIREDYDNLIFHLLDLSENEPITLHLAPEAINQMDELCHSVEAYLRNEHRDMREWGSKYIGLVLRTAGLLHIAADGAGDIQTETVENAIRIGSYAFHHALYAYSILGADETVEKALHVVTKLRKLSVTSISRSDLYQKCRGRFFRDAKEMEPALNLLEQHGYIWLDVPAYSGVGRPSVGTIYVNPAALKDDFSA